MASWVSIEFFNFFPQSDMHNWIDEIIGKCEDAHLGLIGDDSFEIMRLFQVERMKGEVAPPVVLVSSDQNSQLI